MPENITSIFESLSSLSWQSSNESQIYLSRVLVSVLSQVSASLMKPGVVPAPAASFEFDLCMAALPVILGRNPLLFIASYFLLLAPLCLRLIILLFEKTISFADAPPIKCVRIVGMAVLQKFDAWWPLTPWPSITPNIHSPGTEARSRWMQ